MKNNEMNTADFIEALAWRDCFAAAPAELGCAALDVPGTNATLLRAKQVPVPMMNRVIGLDGDAVLPVGTMEWIAQAYRDIGVDNFWTTAWVQPGHSMLEQQLARRAWRPEAHENWLRFSRELDSDPPAAGKDAGLHVRLAQREDVQLAGDIICRGFGLPELLGPWLGALAGRPNWQVYFACDANDVPVATGSVFIHGKQAWMGIGATLPDARRQGAQQILLAARLAAARRAGATTVAIEAEAAQEGKLSHSLNNIRRAGFSEIGLRLNYVCHSA